MQKIKTAAGGIIVSKREYTCVHKRLPEISYRTLLADIVSKLCEGFGRLNGQTYN